MIFDYRTILTLFAALIFSACGGSSNNSNVTPPSSGNNNSGSNNTGNTNTGDTGKSGPTWTQGVFDPSNNFKGTCDTTNENFWLRSWSDETYLWYNEITDQNPENFSDPLVYFEELKTTATTPSGNPKDKFHFTWNTDEYQQLTQSGASAGYGVNWHIIRPSPPRDIRVAYVEKGSPADDAGLQRGDKILTVDGVDAINGNDINTLNDGTWPSDADEVHHFEFERVGENDPVSVSLTSGIITKNAAHTLSTVELLNGDTVGYLLYNTFGTFPAEDALYNAMLELSNRDIDDLVLDLRYNGGGYLYISSQLGYMIAGSTATNNQVYENTVFNDKHPITNPVTGDPLSPTPFFTTTFDDDFNREHNLPSLDLDTVYILTTSSTCSASEALINGLQGIDVNVVLIGSTTCGKPYGFYATDNCGTTYFTIQFRGENAKGFGDYSDGFSPSEGNSTTGVPIDGCIVPDDFSNPLGNPDEALFSAALTHIETGNCPVTTNKQDILSAFDKTQLDTQGSLLTDSRIQKRLIIENSRIHLNERLH